MKKKGRKSMRKNKRVVALLLASAVAMSAGSYMAPVREAMAQEQSKETLTEQQWKDILLGEWGGIGDSITLTDSMYSSFVDFGFGYEEYENPWTFVSVTEHIARGYIWVINFNELEVTVTALHYEDTEKDYYLYGLLPTEKALSNIDVSGVFVLEEVGKADGVANATMGMANDGMSFAEKKAAVLENADATKPSEEVETEEKEEISEDETKTEEKEEISEDETKTEEKEEISEDETETEEKEEISEDETETEEKVETSEETTEEKEPVKPEKVTYTVKAGDTMGIIATNFYGNNANRTRLYEYNKEAFKKTGGKFVVGMELVIPEELGGQKLIPAPKANDGEKLYVVKSGDTLWKIATAELENGSLYTKIFERNKDRLEKATMIYEGQVLVIPAK